MVLVDQSYETRWMILSHLLNSILESTLEYKFIKIRGEMFKTMFMISAKIFEIILPLDKKHMIFGTSPLFATLILISSDTLHLFAIGPFSLC